MPMWGINAIDHEVSSILQQFIFIVRLIFVVINPLDYMGNISVHPNLESQGFFFEKS